MTTRKPNRPQYSWQHAHPMLLGGCALATAGALSVACSATDDHNLLTASSATVNSTTTSAGTGGMGGFNPTQVGGSGGTCSPGYDADGDDWSEAEGDCNDCDPNVNPGAIEVATVMDGTPIDENCDGQVDEAIATCDAGLAFDDLDPRAAARAIEMCQTATVGGKDFGVLQAMWVGANGTQLTPQQAPQFGIQADFGPNVGVQAGERMLVLSSGFARLPGQPGAAIDHAASARGFSSPGMPPPGFPQNVPGCDGGTDIYDDVGLQLKMRAPSNATGFQYQFKFYSFEFAEYVCTNFNDQYIALVDPPPMGSINGNISFDGNNNPVSVNIAFFDVCDPVANNDFAQNCFGGCPPQPNPYCPMGPAELVGNGFDDCFGSTFEDAGATQWLQTTAPIGGGEEFTMRVAIWDTGDNAYDSSVVLDAFEWIATPGTKVGTKPKIK